MASSEKKYVTGLNLHDIKAEYLLDYTGDFELNGSMAIGSVEDKINTRFRNMDDFESFIKAIDFDYDGKDVTFTMFVCKLSTPQFKVVKGSAYSKGTNYMKEIVEYHGQNVYIPSSGMCFIK